MSLSISSEELSLGAVSSTEGGVNALIERAKREAEESRAASSLASEGTFIFTPLPNAGVHEQDDHFQKCLREFCEGDREHYEKSLRAFVKRRENKYLRDLQRAQNIAVRPRSKLGERANFIQVLDANKSARSLKDSHLWGPARRRLEERIATRNVPTDVALQQEEKKLALADIENRFKHLLDSTSTLRTGSVDSSSVASARPRTAVPAIGIYPHKTMVLLSGRPTAVVGGPAQARKNERDARLFYQRQQQQQQLQQHEERGTTAPTQGWRLPPESDYMIIKCSELRNLESSQQQQRVKRAAAHVIVNSRIRKRDRIDRTATEQIEWEQLLGKGFSLLDDLLGGDTNISKQAVDDGTGTASAKDVGGGGSVFSLSEMSASEPSAATPSENLEEILLSNHSKSRGTTASKLPSAMRGRNLAFLAPTTPYGPKAAKAERGGGGENAANRRVVTFGEKDDDEAPLIQVAEAPSIEDDAVSSLAASMEGMNMSLVSEKGEEEEEEITTTHPPPNEKMKEKQNWRAGGIANFIVENSSVALKHAQLALPGRGRATSSLCSDDLVEAASIGSKASVVAALSNLPANSQDIPHSQSGFTAVFGAVKGLLEAEWKANERKKAKARRTERLLFSIDNTSSPPPGATSSMFVLEQAKRDALLLSQPSDIRSRRRAFCQVIRHLMDAGCDFGCTWQIDGDGYDQRNGWSLLHLCASYAGGGSGVWKIAAWLLRGVKCDPNVRTPTGVTPLMLVAQKCQGAKLALVLLSGGADINARDESGWTALHHASVRAGSLMVKSLLLAGADRRKLNLEGKSAADTANDAGYSNIRDMILIYSEVSPPATVYLQQIQEQQRKRRAARTPSRSCDESSKESRRSRLSSAVSRGVFSSISRGEALFLPTKRRAARAN